MNRRIVFGPMLAMALFLVPGISPARLYNVNTGRFQTMDTFQGDQQDPQSLHKYVYVADNPVNNIDPTGHELEELDLVESAEFSFQVGRAGVAQAGKRFALSKIDQIGLSLAASGLLAEELGMAGDEFNTIQTQTAHRANPTKSPNAYVNYKCDLFAQDAKTYFSKQGDNAQIITYDSYPNKTVGDNIVAIEGFGLFGGQNISYNRHHEGVLVDGEVYDNNVPFGVPRSLWENGYEVQPIDKPYGNYYTLRQAHEFRYGVINP